MRSGTGCINQVRFLLADAQDGYRDFLSKSAIDGEKALNQRNYTLANILERYHIM